MQQVRRPDLEAVLAEVAQAFARPARLYLVAATSQMVEGWRDAVPAAELAGDGAADGIGTLVREIAARRGVALVWESPGDVIPLPDGYGERARPVSAVIAPPGALELRHFDPYSVALRLVARGDEADYVVALEYLRRGWVAFDRLEALLDQVLPRFTSATLAQDPAEFRRKFRGLRQVWRAAGAHAPPATGAAAP